MRMTCCSKYKDPANYTFLPSLLCVLRTALLTTLMLILLLLRGIIIAYYWMYNVVNTVQVQGCV